MENKILKAIENLDKKFENKFDNLDKKFEKKFDTLESQVKENTQILKALQYSAEVNKAEHEQIITNITKIQGDISGLRKDLSTMEVVTANNYADLAKLKAVR